MSKNRIKSYISHCNLCDKYRDCNPNKKEYTRIHSHPYAATRLDFFLVSANLRELVVSSKISQSVKSDHKIVSFTINVDREKRGQGYWKFNNHVLLDDKYVALIKKVVRDFAVNNPRGDVSPPYSMGSTQMCYKRRNNKILQYEAKRIC